MEPMPTENTNLPFTLSAKETAETTEVCVFVETCGGVGYSLTFDNHDHISSFAVARKFTEQTGGFVGQIIVQHPCDKCTEYSLTNGNCDDIFAEYPICYWTKLTKIVIMTLPATTDANTTSGNVSIHQVIRFVGSRNLDPSLRHLVTRTVRQFKHHQLNGDYCKFAQLDSDTASLGVFWTIFKMRVSQAPGLHSRSNEEDGKHFMIQLLDNFLRDPNKDISDFDSGVLVPSAAYFDIHDITDFT